MSKASEFVKLILSLPDDVEVVLERASPPTHLWTTVGKLRKEKAGWWGW